MSDDTRRPGRPRSETARLAILTATHDELLDRGYGELTMAGIAARAGVGKQTIYRWWRSKAEVALDALLNVASEGIPIPDEGDLEADLDAFLRRTFGLQEQSRPILMGLLAESLLDPEFAEAFRDRFLAGRARRCARCWSGPWPAARSPPTRTSGCCWTWCTACSGTACCFSTPR
ncbi:hypothetical protein GCM10029978_095500 [Actinoallomurus acanthiterrae]